MPRDLWDRALDERGHKGTPDAGRARCEEWTCEECGAAGDVEPWGDPPDACPCCNAAGSCLLDGDRPIARRGVHVVDPRLRSGPVAPNNPKPPRFRRE